MMVQLSEVGALGWLEYVLGGSLGVTGELPAASWAGVPVCGSNTWNFCGLPSCKTVKSSAFNPGMGRPCLSVTTTSTCTRRAVVLNTGLFCEASVFDGGCAGRASGVELAAEVDRDGGSLLAMVALDDDSCGSVPLAGCCSAA